MSTWQRAGPAAQGRDRGDRAGSAGGKQEVESAGSSRGRERQKRAGTGAAGQVAPEGSRRSSQQEVAEGRAAEEGGAGRAGQRLRQKGFK